MINLHDKNLPDPVGIEPAASLSPLEHNAMEPLRPAGKEFKSPNIVDITKTRLYNFDPPQTPFLYSKTGIDRGIHYFSYFCSKHRLWVLVRTASLKQF